MEFPEHACISCAHLLQPDREVVSLHWREQSLVDGNNEWNDCGTFYHGLVCAKENQYFPWFDANSIELNVQNSIIETNFCKDWTIFQNISTRYKELRTSYKFSKISIMVARKALALAFFGMVITFIITLIIWYLN